MKEAMDAAMKDPQARSFRGYKQEAIVTYSISQLMPLNPTQQSDGEEAAHRWRSKWQPCRKP